MEEETHEGGCLCGAVRYRITGEALGVEYCHCSMCRKAAGAPVVVWMDFDTSAVTWLTLGPKRYASSPDALRGFCSACGSALTFENKNTPNKISLTVGTLDTPEAVAPRQHIYADDQIPWLTLQDNLPRYKQDQK